MRRVTTTAGSRLLGASGGRGNRRSHTEARNRTNIHGVGGGTGRTNTHRESKTVHTLLYDRFARRRRVLDSRLPKRSSIHGGDDGRHCTLV